MARPRTKPDAAPAIPTPKVAAAGVAGAITILIVWVVQSFTNLDIPPEVASAFTTVVAFLAGYIKS